MQNSSNFLADSGRLYQITELGIWRRAIGLTEAHPSFLLFHPLDPAWQAPGFIVFLVRFHTSEVILNITLEYPLLAGFHRIPNYNNS